MSAITDLGNLSKCLVNAKGRIIVPALNLTLGDFLFRIFNEGKDANGGQIGTYRSSWKKVREDNGRQTGYKDLEFSGELRRSIVVGETSEGDAAIGFRFGKQALIAEGQELQTGKEIFKLSETEKKQLSDAISNQLQKEIRECLSS